MRVRFLLAILCCCAMLLGQTAPDLALPAVTLPAGIVITANYNQLGSPAFTGGFGGIYPLSTSLKLYGITGGEFYPKAAIDPTTKRPFYALNVNALQEIHRDMLDAGRLSFLIGIGGGPAISSTPTSGWTASLSTDAVGTIIFRISPSISAVASVKGLYINGAGWNLSPRLGFKIDLPKRK